MTEQEEEIVWEVKQVLDKRTDPVTGTVEYLLEWRNWDGPPTWEPEDNCDCIFLISRFERELRRREDSTNVSPSRRTPSQARGGRSTRARRRRANQLRSSSSSTETKSDSQPPRAGRNTQAHSRPFPSTRIRIAVGAAAIWPVDNHDQATRWPASLRHVRAHHRCR